MLTAATHRALRAVRRRAGWGGSHDGFTLIELLVTVLVASIAAAAILSIFSATSRTFSTGQVRMENQDRTRLAMNQMTRYLRMACSSESITTTRSDAIAIAGPQEVGFYADLDGDGTAEMTRYYVSGATLFMQTAEPVMTDSPPTYPAFQTNGEVIRTGVRNGATPVFKYYSLNTSTGALEEMTQTGTFDLREQILAVEITLFVNDRPDLTRSNVRLVSKAQIRQRYDGGL